MDDRINLVAADDHRLFLEGLKSLFKYTAEFNLIDVCEDGDSLLALISKHKPDIALVDISMPGASTETIIQTVETDHPDTHLIALTMHLEPPLAEKLFNLGLCAYVLKEDAFDELGQAIHALQDGEQYISPKLMKAIVDYHHKQDTEKQLLTIREIDVLGFAAKGQSNKEIARSLEITERTVRFHVSNCCAKLEAQGRSNAVAIAMQMKLITIAY